MKYSCSKNTMKSIIKISLLLTLNHLCLFSQNDTASINEWCEIIHIDTITVTASKTPFDIETFIRLVSEDISLYQSFKGLHTIAYTALHQIQVNDNKLKGKDFFSAFTRQKQRNDCFINSIIFKKFSPGFFKKNGKHKYFTTEIYDDVFLEGRNCHNVDQLIKVHESPKGSGSSYKERIKKMVFSPTSKNYLPIIGDKNMIFSKKNRDKYDFELKKVSKNGFETYELTINAKSSVPDADILIRRLVTNFNITDLQVVHREMYLQYNSELLDLQVHFDIDINFVNGAYYPQMIKYEGNWDIPLHKRELISFQTRFFF